MNSTIVTMNHWGESALRFAWPMLWQSSLLIAVLFMLDLALRRRIRASVRYALWLVVLVKLVLPPSLALPTGLGWWLRPVPQVQTPAQAPMVVTYRQVQPSEIVSSAEITPLSWPEPRGPSLSRAGWSFVASCVVSFALVCWMFRRWLAAASAARRASQAPDWIGGLVAASRQSAPALARKSGALTRRRYKGSRVEVRIVSQPISPAVCGLFRPVILLPAALLEHLSPAQLRAVLLHELAHLRRKDVWINCLQSLLQVAYWWHPLLWLANARIRRLREEAVDDAVIGALHDEAPSYAPTLLEVAKLALNRPLATLGLVGIIESSKALRQRIERLIDGRRPSRPGLTVLSALSILAFSALALPMGEPPPKVLPAAQSPETIPWPDPRFAGYAPVELEAQFFVVDAAQFRQSLPALAASVNPLILSSNEAAGLNLQLQQAGARPYTQAAPLSFQKFSGGNFHYFIAQATNNSVNYQTATVGGRNIVLGAAVQFAATERDWTPLELNLTPWIEGEAIRCQAELTLAGDTNSAQQAEALIPNSGAMLWSVASGQALQLVLIQPKPPVASEHPENSATGSVSEGVTANASTHASSSVPAPAGPARGQDPDASQASRLVVSIDSQGNLRFSPNSGPMTLEQLRAEMAKAIQRNPDSRLEILTEKNTPMRQFVSVVDAAKAAGIQAINLRVKDSLAQAAKESSGTLAAGEPGALAQRGLDGSGAESTATKPALALLIQELYSLERQIAAAQSNLEYLRVTLKIPDTMTNGQGPYLPRSAESLRLAESRRIEARTVCVENGTLLSKLKNTPLTELIQVLPRLVPDALLSDLLSRKVTAEQELIGKRRDFSDNSPEITKLKAEIEGLNDKIKEAIKGIIFGLDLKAAQATNILANIESEIAVAEATDLRGAVETRPFFEAKRKLDQLEEFRRILKVKIETENIGTQPVRTNAAQLDKVERTHGELKNDANGARTALSARATQSEQNPADKAVRAPFTSSPQEGTQNTKPELDVRFFKVETNTLLRLAENATGIPFSKGLGSEEWSETVLRPSVDPFGPLFGAKTEARTVTRTNAAGGVEIALQILFDLARVDLRPPKSYFYTYEEGSLMVRATFEELNRIGEAIGSANAGVHLVSSDIATLKEKIPVLGDLPLVGRVFHWETNHTTSAVSSRNPAKGSMLPANMVSDTNSPGVGLYGVYRDPWGNPYIISEPLATRWFQLEPNKLAERFPTMLGPVASDASEAILKDFRADFLQSGVDLTAPERSLSFVKMGDELPPGAPDSAFHLAGRSLANYVIVRATAKEMNTIERLLQKLAVARGPQRGDVPVLGDLPILGKLFRSETNRVPPPSPSEPNASAGQSHGNSPADRALGFDWWLGKALMNSNTVVGSGGTSPTAQGPPFGSKPVGSALKEFNARILRTGEISAPNKEGRPPSGRRQIMDKLTRIRLDHIKFDGMPLLEVLSILSNEAKKADPTGKGLNFLLRNNLHPAEVNPDGTVSLENDLGALSINVTAPLRDVSLADVLDAIVSGAAEPIRYAIEDYAVVFQFKTEKEPPPLYTRTIKVDPNTMISGLHASGFAGTNSSDDSGALRAFFTGLGVDLQAPKSLYFNRSEGTLLIRATLQDLDTIEAAAQALNIPPTQVQIRARFIELDPADTRGKEWDWMRQAMSQAPSNSNTPNNIIEHYTWNAVLEPAQARHLLTSLEKRHPKRVLASQSVTTLSGRQCQLQTVDIKTVVMKNHALDTTPPDAPTGRTYKSVGYATEDLHFGETLDLVPYVQADDRTIQMTLLGSVTEFLGYDDPARLGLGTELEASLHGLNPAKFSVATLPLPRIRTRSVRPTSVTVQYGQTLVLGSSSGEEITYLQGSEYKVAPSSSKKTILIFVTPQIVDPAGNPIHPEASH